MKKTYLGLALSLLFLLPLTLHAQSTPPGDTPYIPTKLEWAALDLQATSGATVMTTDSPLTITFFPAPDGLTVKCLMQYTSDYPAAALKKQRDAIEYAVSQYRKMKDWPWLRLEFMEHTLGEHRKS